MRLIYFIILLCLMLDDFIPQGKSADTQRVNQITVSANYSN